MIIMKLIYAKLQAKFKQVIDQGVRQIAILTNDFGIRASRMEYVC